MSVMIDQMDRPNNLERQDHHSDSKENEPDRAAEDVNGSYYYDDSTGYEIYRDDEDEESQADEGASEERSSN